MRKIVFLGVFCVPAILMGQEQYTVKGKIGDLQSPAKIFMQYEDGGRRQIDSATVHNGEFKFQGVVKEPSQAYLVLSEEGKTLRLLAQPEVNVVYLSSGVISVQGNNLKEATVSGTALNEEFSKYKLALQPVEDQMKAIDEEYAAAPEEKRNDAAYIANLQDRATKIYALQYDLNKQFIRDNLKSYVSLGLIEEMITTDNAKELGVAFEALPVVYKNTERGKRLGSSIQSLKKLAIGELAPSFTLPDTSGTPLSLSSLKGKYVLVDFWASWCGPCRHENPYVVAAYNKFKDKGFTVLGVSLDNPNGKEKWLKAIADDHLGQWQQVSDLKGWESEVVPLYAIKGIPQNYLLDKDGRIVASNLRGPALEAKLAEILE